MNHHLHEAIIKKDGKHVQELLQQGIDPDLQTEQGQTALMLCVMYDAYQCFYDVLEHTKRINAQNNSGDTALILAVKADSLFCPILLNQEPDIAIKNRYNKDVFDYCKCKTTYNTLLKYITARRLQLLIGKKDPESCLYYLPKDIFNYILELCGFSNKKYSKQTIGKTITFDRDACEYNKLIELGVLEPGYSDYHCVISSFEPLRHPFILITDIEIHSPKTTTFRIIANNLTIFIQDKILNDKIRFFLPLKRLCYTKVLFEFSTEDPIDVIIHYSKWLMYEDYDKIMFYTDNNLYIRDGMVGRRY